MLQVILKNALLIMWNTNKEYNPLIRRRSVIPVRTPETEDSKEEIDFYRQNLFNLFVIFFLIGFAVCVKRYWNKIIESKVATEDKKKVFEKELLEQFARAKELLQILQYLKSLLLTMLENEQRRLASADILLDSEKRWQRVQRFYQDSSKSCSTEADFDKNGNLMELKSHLHRKMLMLDERMDVKPDSVNITKDKECYAKHEIKEANNSIALLEQEEFKSIPNSHREERRSILRLSELPADGKNCAKKPSKKHSMTIEILFSRAHRMKRKSRGIKEKMIYP